MIRSVGIVIPSQGRACLHEAVASAASQRGDSQIIVVLNGCDAPPALKGATILFSEGPLGFAGACNLGMREALSRGCEAVMLLNDDAVLDPLCVSTLTRAMRETPDLGLASASVWRMDDRKQPFFLAGIVDRRSFSAWHVGESDASCGWRVPYLCGCVLMAREELMNDIGLLDEAFFAYYEDVDWSLRALERGWRLQVVPEALAWHGTGMDLSQEGAHADRLYYTCRNQKLCAARHARLLEWPRFGLNYLRRWIPAWRGFRGAGETLKARAVQEGLLDALRSRYGMRPPRAAGG